MTLGERLLATGEAAAAVNAGTHTNALCPYALKLMPWERDHYGGQQKVGVLL